MIIILCLIFFGMLAVVVASMGCMYLRQQDIIVRLTDRQRAIDWEIAQARQENETLRQRRPMVFRGYVYMSYDVHRMREGRQTFIEWMS